MPQTKLNALKNALADAKQVKETALANAKVTLAEQFAPQISNLLADQLAEEVDKDDEDDKVDEVAEPDEDKDDLDETVDIDAILAEIEGEKAEDELDETKKPEGDESEDKPKEDEMDETLDINALLAEFDSDVDEAKKKEDEPTDEPDGDEAPPADEPEDEVDEAGFGDKVKDIGSSIKAGAKKAVDDGAIAVTLIPILKKLGVAPDVLAKIQAKAKEIATALHGNVAPGADENAQLDQAINEVKKITKKLSEVNVHNAKLTYVAKLLHNNNLSESQKTKIVAAFDKASTAKEGKLIYEALQANLKGKTPKKGVVKEGFAGASKAIGVSTKRQVTPDAFAETKARWKQLAFGKK